MIRPVGREHFVSTGVQARHPDCVLVGIRTAVGEEDLVETLRGEVRDALGCFAAREVCRRRRDGRELVCLVLDGGDDGGMLVADIDVDQLAREIEVFVAVEVPDPGAEAAGDDQGLQRALGRP